MIDLSVIRKADPELCAAMEAELKRQRGNIELIASENIVSPAVLAAAGSHLTNKYAEGLPGKRYYGGCQYVDVAENLARERLKALFGCEHCNVQPHSGAQANFAVYFGMLEPGAGPRPSGWPPSSPGSPGPTTPPSAGTSTSSSSTGPLSWPPSWGSAM